VIAAVSHSHGEKPLVGAAPEASGSPDQFDILNAAATTALAH
jgi:hypothetical protein